MFSAYHFIWLAICIALIAGSVAYLRRTKPPLERVLSAACVVAVVSEVVKTFSMLQMVPASDGTTMHVYLSMAHVPLHLCSLQILFIFYTRFSSNTKLREILLAFMYPSCLIGAFLALCIPTILGDSIRVNQAFTHPLGYQYFLYHTMLVVLGLYIPMSGGIDLRPKHYLTSLATIGVLGFASIYMNSIFSQPVYLNGKLMSVEHGTNFFFTFETPIGIPLTEMWHWYLYLAILLLLCVLLIGLCYVPVFVKAAREKRA
ncbi:MAG: YwaF family protein [Clostridia bacterium]|nr:YwaF family protein [Clostridia bacterium]